jgi:hypothetical protein
MHELAEVEGTETNIAIEHINGEPVEISKQRRH